MMYADDVQYYDFRQPQTTALLGTRLTDCGEATNLLMESNRLQLNAAKTDVLWCSSHRRVSQLPSKPLQFCGNSIYASSVVRDLGVWTDIGITMAIHINKVAAGSYVYAVLRQLRSVRRLMTREALTSLVVSLMLPRLDYCNALLAGLPSTQIDRLQSVRNAAAKMIFAARPRNHVTPLLQQLHWLRVSSLVYRCMHGLGPEHLACELQRAAADTESRRRLRSASTVTLVVPAIEHSMLGDCAFPFAAARAWNTLPLDVTSASTLLSFRRRLKTPSLRGNLWAHQSLTNEIFTNKQNFITLLPILLFFCLFTINHFFTSCFETEVVL
jgi:hypothetical protein